MIRFSTENTEGRYILSQSLEIIDELPQCLRTVWNTAKNKNYPSFPMDGEGSRNNELYDFARRLITLKVPLNEARESLHLIYKYFITYKYGFPEQEIDTLVNSAMKKVSEDKTENEGNDHQLYVNEKIIPKPFIIKNGSLYSEKIKNDVPIQTFVSRHTPMLEKEFHNIERPQVLYELTWKQGYQTIKEVVPASSIAVRKDLLQLSEKGLSVNENNVKQLISFMDLYLLDNEIEKHYAAERLGNIKDKFIHPILTKEIEILSVDHGEKQLLEAFEVKGTPDSWKREVFGLIKDQPKAVFMVLSSFASIIIKDLGIQPFIVDLSGTTSQGKTTTLKVAATVWGNENLMNEWNATKVSIERKASYLNSFPLLMDDTRKADERILKDIIYQFSGGRSKGRGSIKGSQREITWNNILLSTGEVSLNEYAKNTGGAAARIIPLVDEPLKKDIDNIIRLHEGMQKNCGAIGIEFLKLWTRERKDFIPEYHRFRSYYQKKARGNEVLTRLAGYYAAIHFVGSILKEKLGFEIDLKAISSLFDDIAEENKAIDKPMQFLEEILGDLDRTRNSILYRSDGHTPDMLKAIYKNDRLHLLINYVNTFLDKEATQIRKEWLKRGITLNYSDNGKKVDYKAEGMGRKRKFRVISLNMDYVYELGFDFEDSTNFS